MIEIIYTGHKGFYHITEANHQSLFNAIKKVDEYNINWHIKPNKNRGHCPYDNTEARGAIQVWDLIHALDQVKNNIFLKLRTDLWFTKESIEIIVDEIKLILTNKQDLSFIGWQYKDWNFNKSFEKISTDGQKHIQDFVIIGNKKNLAPSENIFSKINSRPMSKNVSGNKTFRDLIQDHSKSFTIKTHMYICRKDYKKIDEAQLAIDFFNAYSKNKAEAYKQWFCEKNKKSLSNLQFLKL